ncbi:MAG: ABC transporter permease [Clostridiales bacterium]|nr:ABC transporter permease [Clostridiales bacterium]
MLRYIIRRLIWLIPVIIVVSLIVFVLMELAPGTVVDAMMVEDMTPEQKAELLAKYNLDKPMIYRYGLYMLNLLKGDLGTSQITQVNVWETFLTRLPNTVVLAFSSLIIGAAVSIPLGILASRHAGSLLDNSVTVFSLFGMSMPIFWLGLLLLLLFSYKFGWLPGGGNREGIRSIILPAVCGSLGMIANTARQTRSNMLEVLHADFLRTARAKGVPESVVIWKHALGNAWIPILTTIGIGLSAQLAGSVVIETVFAWPGIGRLAVEAVTQRDATLATGVIILTSIMYVLVQLVVDLLYAFVDPRIKAQYTKYAKRRKRST